MRILTQVKILVVFLVFAGTAQCVRAADYLLGTGDSIRVHVYEHDDLTTDDRISDRGHITFPLLGEVNIAGMDRGQAAEHIADRLTQKKLVKNPQVSVRLLDSASQQVSVLGQVNRPGTYKISVKRTLLEILAEAGGISAGGDDKILIVRVENGATRKFEVDMRDMVGMGSNVAGLSVQSRDVIYVQRAPQFYILGEVQRPGSYRLEWRMTVMQALAVGGGLTARGTANGIKITRQLADGNVSIIDADRADILLPDDLVTIKERLF